MTDKPISPIPPEAVPAFIRKLEAEALRAETEAAVFALEVRVQETVARRAERDEKEHLASNKYNYVYAFNDPVLANSVGSCITQLNTWSRTSPTCAMEIIFNSPGGSIIDGMALYDFIQSLRQKGHYITTTAMGMAASMAGVLLQAGDNRVLGAESVILIHEAAFGAVGKIGEVEDTLALGKMLQKRIVRIFAHRSKLTAGSIERRWRRKDWWMDSDEALKLGLVDEVR